MINCAHCGTQNRDGSKFCLNCGARLMAPSGLICPMCSAPNEVGNVVCSKCGARLVPLVAPSDTESETSSPWKVPAAGKPTEPLEETTRPTEESQTGEMGSSESGSLSWLTRLRASAPVEEESPGKPSTELEEQAAAPVSPDESGTPDWLARLRTSSTTEEVSPSASETMPDWLKPAGMEEETAAPSVPPRGEEPETSSESEQPSWFQRFHPESEPAKDVSSAPITNEIVPDWLKPSPPTPEQPAVPSVEEASAEPARIATTETELPPWLEELKPSVVDKQELTSTEELALEPRSKLGETGVPAEASQTRVPTGLGETPVVEPSGDEGIPDWLRTAPSAEGLAERVPTAETAVLPEGAPEWVNELKWAAQPTLGDRERVETEGPLAGLRGVLPLAVAITEPHVSPKVTVSEPRPESAHLFDSILAAPAAETITPSVKKPRRVWTMRPLIYLLLALEVLVSFLIPSDLASSTLKISGTPAAECYDTLQGLPASSAVLLAFDYDPSQAGEMDMQAKAIVRYLIQRRVNVIAISTLDTGAPIAKRILDEATRGVGNYAYGANYVNLGYLPGHEAGLANLATNGFPAKSKDFVQNRELSNFPLTANVKTLRDVQLVIELAGSEDTLKAWMEQVQPRAGIRIVAGVSAAVEPKARVYRDTPTKQLAAMMSGLVGAAQYEVLSGQPGLAVISVNAQSAAQLLLVFIIVLGNIIHWFSRARGQAE